MTQASSINAKTDMPSAEHEGGAEGYPDGREDHHIAPEPPEEAPFCDQCFGYHDWRVGCPEDEPEDD